MLRAAYTPYRLDFNFKALTSRGALPYKDTFYVKVWDEATPDKFGIGECALFRGLSKEDTPQYEQVLYNLCRSLNRGEDYDISAYSSIRFGLETAMSDFKHDCLHTPFPSEFVGGASSITINGLVWMGSIDEMCHRAEQKIAEGFRCIKFKVGGQNFEQEFQLLERLREKYGTESLEIRIDANGAFTPENAQERLNRLASLDIHSIEQPIAAGQWEAMATLCRESPIPIALDEELIGCYSIEEKCRILDYIHPSYIILKPALCGGFCSAKEWIAEAVNREIGWWVTSSLESNIGLNAIAQWVGSMNVEIPQGLGTGGLFTNNIHSPLVRRGEELSYNPSKEWSFPELQWIAPE
ncbi:MAG: o-succinylbenzoate synthase [Paramuribaculum sp.]|nr:o-succinylbenzoate synthase [Paramuribaculum sp.]